jgi:hypothetical protein
MNVIRMHVWGRSEPAEIDPDVLEEATQEENTIVYRDPVTNVYRVGKPGSRWTLYPSKGAR